MQTDDNKKVKKGFYTLSELDEIKAAMDEEGFKSWSEYSLHMIRTRAIPSDAETRRKQMLAYRYANLQTLHNKMFMRIDTENTINQFMKEVDLLCRDLV